MQSHDEGDFMDRLRGRAKAMAGAKVCEITAGKEGEPVLDEWQFGRLYVVQRPDDEQGVLRISVGGGVASQDIDYCVIRGNPSECAFLLETAAKAIRDRVKCSKSRSRI